MILSVDSNKIANCYCDALLRDNYAVVFVSLLGSTNSVRTAWAKLRGDYGVVHAGSEVISLNKDWRYLKLQSPLNSPGTSQLVLIEEQATHQVSNSSQFYQIGKDSKVDFFVRLDKLCSVPFRKSWSPYLWEKGRKEGLIRELNGFGMEGYRVDTSEKEWSEIVISGLQQGCIS